MKKTSNVQRRTPNAEWGGALNSVFDVRRSAFGVFFLRRGEYQGGDSNPYGLLHQILSLARLPISPPWYSGPNAVNKRNCRGYASAGVPNQEIC